MSENKKQRISFTLEKNITHKSQLDMTSCERLYLADIDVIGQMAIIIPRYNYSGNKCTGEVEIYDYDYRNRVLGKNSVSYDSWNGACFDVAVSDIDGDGSLELIAVGGVKNTEEQRHPKPTIRVYNYSDEGMSLRGQRSNLNLCKQISAESPEECFSAVRGVSVSDIDGDGKNEIVTLTTSEGQGDNAGYAELKLFDAELNEKQSQRFKPPAGTVSKWGGKLFVGDVDNDGNPEIVTVINFRHEYASRMDMRIFDAQLQLKAHNESVSLSQKHFATGLTAADIDSDGQMEIIITGGAFPEGGNRATSEILLYDDKLQLKREVNWTTLKHSWVWDVQVAELNAKPYIITFGGSSMRGRNQDDANVFSEIRLWDGNLQTQDIFLWQSEPGKDTRASRGCLIPGDVIRFALATSKWVDKQRDDDTEICLFQYQPVPKDDNGCFEFIDAWNKRKIDNLAQLVHEDEMSLKELALEGLATSGEDRALALIAPMLEVDYQPLFLRTVQVLRDIGSEEAIAELQKVGYATYKNFIIIAPFDNTNNAGFDTEYPPEKSIDLGRFYAGMDKIVRWGKIADHRLDIYVDLAYTHFESFERTGVEYGWNRRNTEAVAYALTYINAPEKMNAQLKIGSCDGIKVWLNGEQLWSNNNSRKAKIDEDVVPVQLSAGRNELLLKVVNYETNDWGFYCRIYRNLVFEKNSVSFEQEFEIAHIHNQILSHEQLLHLANSEDDRIRCFAANELAVGGDKRGIEALAEFLQSQDESVRARAALKLTRLKDQRGIETLVKLTPGQNYFFQLDASYALQGVGDARAESFSLTNLKDGDGNKVGALKIADGDDEFSIVAKLCDKEMGDIYIGVKNRTLHFGDNIGAKYASIGGFGMYAPKYRGKGIGAILINKASQMMAERGFSCSMVGTGTKLLAHRLYTRYGYVDAAFRADYIKNLESEADIPCITDNSVTVRRYDKEDEAEIKRLREDYCLNSIGPVNSTPRDRFGPWTMVMKREDKIIGYADAPYDLSNPIGRINIVHIDSKIQACLRAKRKDSKDREKYTKVMLSEIYRYFLDEGKNEVIFHDPPSHIRRMLMQLGHHPDENSERHGWVGMFKIIDLAKLLNEISELLKLRLERSIYSGFSGEIGILGSRLHSTLTISGEVKAENDISPSADIVVETSDKILTELMIGKADIWEAYRQLTFTTKPGFNERIRGLLETLFPIMERRERGWW